MRRLSVSAGASVVASAAAVLAGIFFSFDLVSAGGADALSAFCTSGELATAVHLAALASEAPKAPAPVLTPLTVVGRTSAALGLPLLGVFVRGGRRLTLRGTGIEIVVINFSLSRSGGHTKPTISR